MLTEDEMWRAILRRDASADGVFWYGDHFAGVFCRPSCPGPTPRRDRVCFFRSPAEAVALGWLLCPRCGNVKAGPVGFDAGAEQLYTLLVLFDAFYADREQLSRAVRGCGFRKRRILRLFRKYLDMPPGPYMCGVRLEKAKEKLRAGASNILEVALSCGFNSLSHFYEKFRENTGLTPAHYRKVFLSASAPDAHS